MSPSTPHGPPARRPRAVAAVGGVLTAVLALAACGQESPRSVAAEAGGGTSAGSGTSTGGGTSAGSGDERSDSRRVLRLPEGADRPRLRCPTGERSVMVADFAVNSKGAATPADAVGVETLEDGEQLVVSHRGARVWILRADGTAREENHLIRMRGWLIHMREACA